MPYKQLTDYERYLIHHLKIFKRSNAEIARQLERSPSTISREIRRNANSMGQYFPEPAQQFTQQRRLAPEANMKKPNRPSSRQCNTSVRTGFVGHTELSAWVIIFALLSYYYTWTSWDRGRIQ